MKKFLLGGAVALVLSVPAPAFAWIAAAANDYGSGSGAGGSEESARSAAISDCEQQTGYTCDYMTTSVPDAWYLIVVRCPNGSRATGASKHDYGVANHNAAIKVGYRRCRSEAQY